jgi:hypothetical protein
MLLVLSSKTFRTRQIHRLGAARLKNELGHVTHQPIVNFVNMKKIAFEGQKGKNKASQPKKRNLRQ